MHVRVTRHFESLNFSWNNQKHSNQSMRIKNSIQLTNSQRVAYSGAQPEPCVQWPSELRLVVMDEVSLVVGDVVKV